MTAHEALARAHAEFPVGARVRDEFGAVGTVVDATMLPTPRNWSKYNRLFSAFIRPRDYPSGLGGPYIAVQFDGAAGLSDRAADRLSKIEDLAAEDLAADALNEAAENFPIGTRIRDDQGREGITVPADVRTGYQINGAAFVRPDGFADGLGGPYIAVRSADGATSFRLADIAESDNASSDPVPLVVNVTVYSIN